MENNFFERTYITPLERIEELYKKDENRKQINSVSSFVSTGNCKGLLSSPRLLNRHNFVDIKIDEAHETYPTISAEISHCIAFNQISC